MSAASSAMPRAFAPMQCPRRASCDPLYRKAIRVLGRRHLDRTFARLAPEEDPLAILASTASRRSRSPHGGEPLDAIAQRQDALLLGAEGPLPQKSARREILFHGGGIHSLNVATPAASSPSSHVAAVMPQPRRMIPTMVSAPSVSLDAGGESPAPSRRAPRSRRNTGRGPQQDEEVHRVEAAHLAAFIQPSKTRLFDGDRLHMARSRRVRKPPMDASLATSAIARCGGARSRAWLGCRRERIGGLASA